MSVKLVITDLDGCVSPEESVAWNMELFSEFARVCREASAGRGNVPPITICTGRPQPYVETLAKLLDVRLPVICENGAVIYSLHDNRSRFGPGVTDKKVQGLRAVRGFIETEILPSYPSLLMQFGKEAQMSVFSEQPEIFGAVQQRVEEFIEENDLPELVIGPSHFYLNLSLAGVDKGNALRAVLAETGVDKQHAAGIGDTEGDLPLRESVGFFACPANAKGIIKDVADYISPYPTLQGVLDILGRPEIASGVTD